MNSKFLQNIQDNFDAWILIKKAIEKDRRLSLVKFLKQKGIRENLRSNFIQMGLIKNLNLISLSQPVWEISKDINTIEEFKELYLKVQQENKGVIYVFDENNKLIYKSINKHDIAKKFGVQHKTMFIIVRNGEPKNGVYFSFDEKFKITHKAVEQNKVASKQKRKGKLKINSYEHKKTQALEAAEVLKVAKKQNKPVKRLTKLGLEKIKSNCLK